MSDEQDARRCDFFVSYTGADTAWAEWIAWQLTEAGYAVMIQAWHLRPGMNFLALMRQALDTCQRTVAVVSKAYLDQSTHGSDEWTAAFTHDDPHSSLLLVLVEPVTLPHPHRLPRPDAPAPYDRYEIVVTPHPRESEVHENGAGSPSPGAVQARCPRAQPRRPTAAHDPQRTSRRGACCTASLPSCYQPPSGGILSNCTIAWSMPSASRKYWSLA